jgi:DNA-binding transcriptional LysR family regulator
MTGNTHGSRIAGSYSIVARAGSSVILLYEPAGKLEACDRPVVQAGGELARPGMELGNIEAIKKMVGAGLGVSLIPSMAMGEGDEGLTARSLSPRLYRRIGMVLRRDKVPDAALRAVIKALDGIAGSLLAGPSLAGILRA